MGKKVLTVIALVMIGVVLSFIFGPSLISKPAEDTGTCCNRLLQDCVVGSVVINDAYYIPQGPC